jgi:hypothetical protein
LPSTGAACTFHLLFEHRDAPQGPADVGQVFGKLQVFMADQLCPSTFGSVRQVLHRSLPLAVAAPGGLEVALPKEGIAGIAVSEPALHDLNYLQRL